MYPLNARHATSAQSSRSEQIESLRASLNADELENVRSYLAGREDSHRNTLWNRIDNYPGRKELLPAKVKKLVMEQVMAKKLAELPSDKEIQQFTLALETSPLVVVNAAKMRSISYARFQSVAPEKGDPNPPCPMQFKRLLQTQPPNIQAFIPAATLFAESSTDLDEKGRLGTDHIVNFTTLKRAIHKNRIQLTRYDLDFSGYLNKNQLMDYLHNEVVPRMELMQCSERDAYLETVMLMFSFFLDAKRTGHYRIADMLASGFIENIFALQDLLESYDENGRAAIRESWFAPEKTQQVLAVFRSADKENKSYLTHKDFIDINGGESGFTPVFVNRLFQVHVSRGGTKMSGHEYVTFEIAHDHMQHSSAINYFFKVLDLGDKGYLTRTDLRYFYEDVQKSYDFHFAFYLPMPCFDDYFDQLFDMVHPAASDRITRKDLLNCKQGHDFINCLISYLEFYRFETREDSIEMDSQMPEEEEEEDEPNEDAEEQDERA